MSTRLGGARVLGGTGPVPPRPPRTATIATRGPRTATASGALKGPWGGANLISHTVTTVAGFSGTHVYQLPTVAIGDRLTLVASCLDGIASFTPSTDLSAWTSFLASELNPFHCWRGYTLFISDAAAVTAWSGATVTFASANGGKSTAVAVRVADGASGAVTVGWDFAGPTASGSDAAPNPPQLVPGWGDDQNLWLTFVTFGSGGDSATTQPQDYHDLAQGGAAADQTTTAVAVRYKADGGEDPGAFTLTGAENWQALTFAIRPVQPAAGLLTVNLAGAMTSTGALTRRSGKALASAMASAGVLTRRPGKALTGAAVSSGALTATRAVLRAFSGALTSSGALARQTSKPLAGATSSTGTLTRRAGKALTGAMANSGALTTIKLVLRTFTGAMTSTGVLTRQARKPLTGTTTSGGVLTRRTGKALTGTLSSSGALSTARVVLLALAGAMASTGTLTRRAGKALTGTTASAGALARQPRKALTGTLTSSGVLTRSRLVVLALSGAMASTGTLVRRTTKTMAGTVTSAGVVTRRTGKALAGTVASAGVVTRRIGKTLAGFLTTVGDLATVLIGSALPATGRRRARTGDPRHRAHPGRDRFDAGTTEPRFTVRPAARHDTSPGSPRHKARPRR